MRLRCAASVREDGRCFAVGEGGGGGGGGGGRLRTATCVLRGMGPLAWFTCGRIGVQEETEIGVLPRWSVGAHVNLQEIGELRATRASMPAVARGTIGPGASRASGSGPGAVQAGRDHTRPTPLRTERCVRRVSLTASIVPRGFQRLRSVLADRSHSTSRTTPGRWELVGDLGTCRLAVRLVVVGHWQNVVQPRECGLRERRGAPECDEAALLRGRCGLAHGILRTGRMTP